MLQFPSEGGLERETGSSGTDGLRIGTGAMKNLASSVLSGLVAGGAFLAVVSAAAIASAAGGSAAAAPSAVGGAPFVYGAARFGSANPGSPLGNVQTETQGNPTNLWNQPSAWSNVPASISGYSTGGYQYGGLDVRNFNRGLSNFGSGYYGPTDSNYAPAYSREAATPTYGTLGRPGFQGFQDGAFEIGGYPQGVGTFGGR
jgi:hypothetical protein